MRYSAGQTSAVLARSNDARPAAPSTQPRSLDHGSKPLAAGGGSGGRKTAATRSAAVIDSETATGAGGTTILATGAWLLTRGTGLAVLAGRRLRAVPAADGSIAGVDWRRFIGGPTAGQAPLPKRECIIPHGLPSGGLQLDAAPTLSTLAPNPNMTPAANILRQAFIIFQQVLA